VLPSLLADAALLLHLTFVVFVIFGALCAFHRPRIAWIHVPMVLWSAVVNMMQWTCPLTPLEKYFRAQAGQAGYEGGFIAHYLVPLIYPQGMSYEVGVMIGFGVFIGNVVIYGLVIYRARRSR